MLFQRRARHAHQIGVSILVPHSSFTPTPTMTPLQIAFHKGQDAKRRGRPAENPHTDLLTPNEGALAKEWDRGYNS